MRIPDTLTGLRSLRYTTLAAGLSLLTPGALFAQSADQKDVSALKAQMERMQKQYEERISSMESEMKTLESKANTGSILNTRLLTDANGVAMDDKGGKSAPMLDESFLKSLTRNFTFSAYVRAGVQVNGSGGGGNFNFEPPDYVGGRARLGNENDVYMELTWSQAHLLGDSPDVMDVSMTFTPAIVYVQNRNTFTSAAPSLANGNDFNFVMRQAFLEMKNVFKSAPEVTFWGGERFYDRFNIDPNDYFYLDTSGYGAGVENIDLGFGKLWVAYLGGLNDSLISPTTGTFYKHTLDVRIKDINVGLGKLMLVGIGNYEKGTTFTTDFNGNTLDNPVRTSDAWGIGGGAVWEYDFGNKSLIQLYGLFGWGSTNFSSGDDLGTVTAAAQTFLARNPGRAGDGTVINAGQAIQKQHVYRAGGQFIWNPSSTFSLGTWAFWQQDAQGYGVAGTDVNGIVKSVAVTRNLYTVGVRPVFWFADNFAIQGQAVYNYQDNNRGYSGTNAFGRSGSMGVFTIAPTLKPKGGYFSRPELRVFATWAVWSNSLKGATTPINEGGNLGGSIPPYGGVGNKANSGWLFGTQVEWFF